MAEVFCGVSDGDEVSPELIVSIQHPTLAEGSPVNVNAYLGEGGSVSLSSTWESLLEGATLGNVSQAVGSYAQDATGNTTVTKENSRRSWGGTTPPEMTVELNFVAKTDALKEVDEPIRYLLMMASPDLNETLPFEMDGWRVVAGKNPIDLTIKIGSKFQLIGIITEISYNLSAPRTVDGYFAYNTVSLSISARYAQNYDEIPTIFKA